MEGTRGRPRDASRDVAITEATLALLKEVGYDDLSVGAIADRAGVSKATIYRRWPNKAAIVSAAVQQDAVSTFAEPSDGDLRASLLDALRWLARAVAEQDLALLGAMFAGMRSDPDLARAMRDRLSRDQALMTERALGAARARGEKLHPQAEELFAEIAPAMIVHRVLMGGELRDEAFLVHLVDDVLLPLLSR